VVTSANPQIFPVADAVFWWLRPAQTKSLCRIIEVANGVEVLVPAEARDEIVKLAAALRADHRERNQRLFVLI
jgi:hypothetical protein